MQTLLAAGLVLVGGVVGTVAGFLVGRTEHSHAQRLEALEALRLYRRIFGHLYVMRVPFPRDVAADIQELGDRLTVAETLSRGELAV